MTNEELHHALTHKAVCIYNSDTHYFSYSLTEHVAVLDLLEKLYKSKQQAKDSEENPST